MQQPPFSYPGYPQGPHLPQTLQTPQALQATQISQSSQAPQEGEEHKGFQDGVMGGREPPGPRPPKPDELEGLRRCPKDALHGWFPVGGAPSAFEARMNKAAQEEASRPTLYETSFSIGPFKVPASHLPSYHRCQHIRSFGHCVAGDCYLQRSIVENHPYLCENPYCGSHAWPAGPGCLGMPRLQLRSIVEEAKAFGSTYEYYIVNMVCFAAMWHCKIELEAQGEHVPVICDYETAVVGFQQVKWRSRGTTAYVVGMPTEDGSVVYLPSEATQKGFNFKGIEELLSKMTVDMPEEAIEQDRPSPTHYWERHNLGPILRTVGAYHLGSATNISTEGSKEATSEQASQEDGSDKEGSADDIEAKSSIGKLTQETPHKRAGLQSFQSVDICSLTEQPNGLNLSGSTPQYSPSGQVQRKSDGYDQKDHSGRGNSCQTRRTRRSRYDGQRSDKETREMEAVVTEIRRKNRKRSRIDLLDLLFF